MKSIALLMLFVLTGCGARTEFTSFCYGDEDYQAEIVRAVAETFPGVEVAEVDDPADADILCRNIMHEKVYDPLVEIILYPMPRPQEGSVHFQALEGLKWLR